MLISVLSIFFEARFQLFLQRKLRNPAVKFKAVFSPVLPTQLTTKSNLSVYKTDSCVTSCIFVHVKDHLQLTHKISQWIQRPRIKSTKSFLLNHWEHNLNWGNLIYIDDDKADGIHILLWHSAPRNSKRSKNSYGTNEHILEMLNQKKKKKVVHFFNFLCPYHQRK